MSTIIFPPQLFYDKEHIKFLQKADNVYLIEEPRYFTDFNFHKLKIAYHRASMKKYQQFLIDKQIKTIYIEYIHVSNKLYKSIKNPTIIFLPDHKLMKKLLQVYGQSIIILDNINFLVELKDLQQIKKQICKNGHYNHKEFYKYQRKKLNILIQQNQPEGGKWSYDTENRISLPKNHIIPKIKECKSNSFVIEAIKYTEKNFKNNYGSLDNFIYPIDYRGAVKWLNLFLKERLQNFGKYQDAVHSQQSFLYHSVLSPMMNIGVITDKNIISISYDYYQKNNINIQSFEGFIRQIIGWRNYVYTIYLLEGEKLSSSNQFNSRNRLPYTKFWEGSTNVQFIDDLILKIVKYGYVHHIERLMFLGNFMFLSMIHPKDVYTIFMEWTIDSYDWVMVPNVYGMSQFCSPIMMKRPYFASSVYISKMSDYKQNDILNALYYNFIHTHQSLLKKNYATASFVTHWNNKNIQQKQSILHLAQQYLKRLFHSRY